MAKLRIEGEAFASAMSSCGSPVSSWMSDLSLGSEADQSLHSFSQSQSQQGEALAEPEFNQSLFSGVEVPGDDESYSGPRRGSLEGEVVLSENRGEKGTPTKERRRKLPPSMAKTTIQSLTGLGNLSPFKTAVGVHPCVAVKPMVIQEPTILSSSILTKDQVKFSTSLLASMSSEMSFEDPWLKRGSEERSSRELVCEVKPEKREAKHSKSEAGYGDHQSLCRDGKSQ